MVLADRQLLWVAVTSSVLLHAIVLSIDLVSPDESTFRPFAQGLDVILVNTADQRAPLQADAIAQANLDGGGNADSGRATSPVPNTGQMSDGSALQRQRQRVAELEKRQAHLLAQLKERKADYALPASGARTSADKRAAPESEATMAVLERREAEIARRIADYNKRPVKTQLTPSTSKVDYALYYTALQQRIEHTGTRYFPEHGGEKLYGELVIYIPVYQDGSIYEKEGGPRVERSSGNVVLDQAALRIVRRAAPFGQFPAALRQDGKTHVWEIVTRFHFTRDQTLASHATGVAP